jgi:hypothetical protein
VGQAAYGPQACSHPGFIDEVLATVEPHHQGIDPQVAGNVPANHKFLSQVDPILGPWSLMNFSISAADWSD